MGLMDEIEAAESARARGEPVGGRTRRRIGVVVSILGIFLVLLASWATSWHVMDFDVIGYDRAQVKVGLWDVEVCPPRGDCDPMPRSEFERSVGQLSRSSDAAMDDWLDARWQVGLGLFLSAAAAAVLLFFIVSKQSFRATRMVAAGTFVVALVTLLLTWRSAFAAPIEFMGHGAAMYLAFAGLFDLLLGAVLIGITRVEAGLARAVVVKR